MKIAILHYHLNPGGVTRIIESQVRGLSKADRNAEMIILCGNSLSESDFAEVPVIEDDCMLYDESGEVSAIHRKGGHDPVLYHSACNGLYSALP